MELLDFQLTLGQMVILVLLYGGLAWFGHPEYLLGIYLSYVCWMRPVMFGPIANTWVLMTAILLASFIYILNTGRFKYLPFDNRWFAYWMSLWWFWILILLLCLNNSQLQLVLLRIFICSIIFPVLLLFIFSHDILRVKGFIIAYIISSICCGLLTLYIYKVSMMYILTDPLLRKKDILFFGGYNYHWMGQIFAISIILTTALYFNAHNIFVKLILLITIALLGYFLYLSGSRHAVLGFCLAFSLMIIWALKSLRNSFFSIIVILITLIFLSAWLYQTAPSILTRSDSANVEDALVSSTSKRVNLWEKGLEYFANSPIWGTGFEQYVITHNFIIGVLADQGLVGFIMLMGLLVFLFQLTFSVWKDTRSSLLTIFRIAFWCITFFCFFHSQFNGSIMSNIELYWSTVLLWSLGSSDKEAEQIVSPYTLQQNNNA